MLTESLDVHISDLKVPPGALVLSETCYNSHVQASSITTTLSLEGTLVQLDMLETDVKAGTQQTTGISGSQRKQWTSTIQRQRA